MPNRNFSYLIPAFSVWYDRLHDASTLQFGGNPTNDLLQKLGMNRDSFQKTFLNPWLKLSPELIQEILVVLTKEMHYASNTPVTFECNDRFQKLGNSLQWLVVNLQELNILPITSDLVYFEPPPIPYRQCRYCGKPDHDRRTKPEKKFNDVLKYCHTDACPGAGSNPEMHVDADCCYGYWARDKKVLITRLDNANNEEGSEIFLDFCKEQLQRNLMKTTHTIQTKESPAHEYKYQSRLTGEQLFLEWLEAEKGIKL